MNHRAQASARCLAVVALAGVARQGKNLCPCYLACVTNAEEVPEDLPRLLRERVERLVLEQATRSERALSFGREGFCGLVLLRFLVLGGGGSPAAWVTVPAVILAMAFSASLLLRRGPFSARLLCISSVVDAVTCLAALVPNVLWPWPEYRGLLLAPDVTAILLIVSVSGLRLSRRATQIAIACNVASATLLVALDTHLNGKRSDVDAGQIALGLLWLSTASWIAWTMANKGMELASRSAIASLKGAFATQNLRALLAGHHDARTLLSSVTLHADLLARRLATIDSDAESRTLARALQSDLSELRGFERSIKEHAWGAVVAGGEPVVAHPGEAFHAALRIVQTTFPDVRVTFASSPQDLCVRAVGGSDGLGRALLNVLVNACEGNDRGKATTIQVDVGVAPTEGMVTLIVDDDGPGFPDEHVAAPLERPRTTKETGSGLGLLLVRSFVEASGGTLTLGNGSRGARVELRLPAGRLIISS